MDDGCFEQQVYYRQSADGVSWGATTKVTSGPRDFQDPVGVTHDNGKAIVVFDSFDAGGSSSNVLVRQGS